MSNRSIRNVFWNLAGGAWVGILTILATPWYVSRLGLEGYGMLGLWLMMQVMMGILDIGMGATLVREFANSGWDKVGVEFKRDLLKTLEVVYWALAVILTLTLFLVAGWIGDHWLTSSAVLNTSASSALRLMAITLGLQFPYAIYSNGLSGIQAHGRMNAIQIIGNSLRYGCGVAILFWRVDLEWFFGIQAMVAAVQTLSARWLVWKMISQIRTRPAVFSVTMLRQVWRFSFGMALTAAAAVLMANADRIALSKMVNSVELGKYALAFTATGLLQMGIQPFYRAFFPRYAELIVMGDEKKLKKEYFRSCRLMALVMLPIAVVGWIFADDLFFAWIGKTDQTIVSVFRLLIIGITFSGLMWLPAAFQQAHGWTHLHATMIAGALVIGAPVMVWAISTYGTVGATTVWFLHGVSDITLGLWLMHRRLLIGDFINWYKSVLFIPAVVSISLGWLSSAIIPESLNKWGNLCWIGITCIAMISIALFFSFGRHDKDSESNKNESFGT